MCTEPHNPLVTEIGLDWIYSSYEHIEAHVEFLFVDQVRIIYIFLQLVFIMVTGFWQLAELFNQLNSAASTALRRLSDEGLARVPAQKLLEVPHLIGQQEGIGHKFIVKREESL